MSRSLGYALSFGLSLLVAVGVAAADDIDLLDEDVAKLVESYKADDYASFSSVLDSGRLDPSVFGSPLPHSLLCETTSEGKVRYLKKLLDAGVDPNVQNPRTAASFRTPLSCAATRFSSEAIDLLLAAGADTTVELCHGCSVNDTPLTIAPTNREFIERVLRARRLTPFEVEYFTWHVQNMPTSGIYNGEPVVKWYQNLLDDYGVTDVYPLD